MNYQLDENLKPFLGCLQEMIGPFTTDMRLDRFASVATQRSRQVVSLFEDTHHTHNISAVLRTHDALGFQDLLFLYHRDKLGNRSRDSVERGSSRWLSVRRMRSVEQCVQLFKECGYAIALVSLPDFAKTGNFFSDKLPCISCGELNTPIFQQTLNGRRLALIFGNEADGVSPEWTKYADMYLYVPMQGFVESLNVSVCAAILLNALRQQQDLQCLISETESLLLREQWVAGQCTEGREIVKRYRPEALPYYSFVKTGRFFTPNGAPYDKGV